jgi:hypothetical protein
VIGTFTFPNGGNDCSGANPQNITGKLKLTYSPKVEHSVWHGKLDTYASSADVQVSGEGMMTGSYPAAENSVFSTSLGAMSGSCQSGVVSASFTTPAWRHG